MLIAFVIGLFQSNFTYAAVAVVQNPSSVGTLTAKATTTTLGSFALSASVTPTSIGNLLVVGYSLKNKSGTPTISGTGWVLQTSICATGDVSCTYAYTKLATSTAPETVTITVTNASADNGALMSIFEYSGATNTSINFATSSGNSTSPTSGTVTPSVDNTLLFAIFTQGKGTAYTGADNGFTKEFSDKITTPAGAVLNIGYVDKISGNIANTAYSTTPTISGQAAPWSSIIFNFDTQQSQTAAPVITSTLVAGNTSVSGTSTEANGTTIQIYADGVATGTTTTVSSGTWTKTGLTALTAGQAITAKATAAGKSTSLESNSVTVLAISATPTITSTLIA